MLPQIDNVNKYIEIILKEINGNSKLKNTTEIKHSLELAVDLN